MMGFLDLFKKKEPVVKAPEGSAFLSAAASGTVVPMAEIPDEAFASGVMGWCCGIDPDSGEITAPVSGTIMQVADSFHAFGIDGGNGVKVIIHVGIDTVAMQGNGFSCKIREGEKVTKGQTLLTVDLDKVYSAGYPAIVIMAVLNTDEFSSIELTANGQVKRDTEMVKLNR